MFENVFFDPWIGKNYGTELSIFRKKILILGNSHYCEDCEDCGNRELHPDCTDLTRRVIIDYLDPEHKAYWKSTFSTFINSMYNKPTSIKERRNFFESISFYNYLQIAAGEDPYSTEKYDYTDDRYLKAFYEVINKTLPDVVICWGNKLWDLLPDNWGDHGEAEKGTGINVGNDVFTKYYTYPYKDDKKIMLIGIRHPSMAFSRDYHYQIFSELIFSHK